MSHPVLAVRLLRLGLAGAFLYAAISGLAQPQQWMGYLPGIILTSGFAGQVMLFFSLTELILALWLLSGWRPRQAGFLAVAILAGIIGANITALDLIFRDVAILFAAAALAALSEK